MQDALQFSEAQSVALQIAAFGAGCFWCVEAVFQELQGVDKVVSGYAGGKSRNPNYEEVCTGQSGHAELCQIYFRPELISYTELLDVFWKTHDPTSLNRQGNDIGTQYRSVIFYHDKEQKNLALESRRKLERSGVFQNPIQTQIEALEAFYPAEDYHQNYYRNHPEQSYCIFMIRPKLEKLHLREDVSSSYEKLKR